MPWVSKTSHQSERAYWMVAILAAVVVGLLIGYERWGTTATVVTIVERELAGMEKRIYAVERRINALESRAAETAQGKPKPDWRAEVAKSRVRHTSKVPSH
jgi:hypothetical protein